MDGSKVTDPTDLENIKQCLTRMLNTQYSMNQHKSSVNENSVRPGAILPAKSVEDRQKADLLYSLMDRRVISIASFSSRCDSLLVATDLTVGGPDNCLAIRSVSN